MSKSVWAKIGIFAAGVVVAVAPLSCYFVAHPKVYTKTYYAALVDKVNSLESKKDKKKIVLIGGSNVAFGFDSKYIAQAFPDYEVVNFGLYASLGTKIMMDLSKTCLNEGDLAFIIPEINEQSMSLYFSGENTLKAIEDKPSIFNMLPKDNKQEVMDQYTKFVADNYKIGKTIEPSGVYQRKNFNSYGDIEYTEQDSNGFNYRSMNRMAVYYDPSMPVSYESDLDTSFIDYVKEFGDYATSVGATAYYSYSPVDEDSIVYTTENRTLSVLNFKTNIEAAFKDSNVHTVGNPNRYVMDAHYFYDTNFHLNDAGARKRTKQFIEDLDEGGVLSMSEDFEPEGIDTKMPSYPDAGEIGDDSETASYFEYTEENGSYYISGVKEDHVNDTTFELPEFANHRKVVGIMADAFEDCTALSELTIQSYTKVLKNGCFGNCATLKKVKMVATDPNNTTVDFMGGLVNNIVSSEFKFYIPTSALNDYSTHYYWGKYSKYFVAY